MRRQTAQFWVNLSILVASVLLLAGVSFATTIPHTTEFKELLTAGGKDFKPLVTIPEDPAVDQQEAFKARAYKEKQADWFAIATLLEARDKHLAALEAARQAERVRVRSRPKVQAEGSPATVPQPATTPIARGGSDACGGWRDLVDNYAWNVDTACRILLCESKGNPLAQNRSGASGLMQLLPGPPGWQDPKTNMDGAYSKYLARGWQPWVCH